MITRNRMLLLLTAIMLVACADPFQTSADSRVEQARLLANAQIQVAQAQADASKYTSLQGTIQTSVLVGILPWLVLLICVTVVISLVVNWQGRIWFARTGQTMQPGLPAVNQLQALARKQGYMIVESDKELLVYNKQNQLVGRKLLHD